MVASSSSPEEYIECIRKRGVYFIHGLMNGSAGAFCITITYWFHNMYAVVASSLWGQKNLIGIYY